MPTSAFFAHRWCQDTPLTARFGLNSWLCTLAFGSVVLSAGCATAPPCRCSCETCYVEGAQGAPQPQVATADDAGRDVRAATNERVDVGKSRSRGVSRAGETLTEGQLLERYEGKRAVQVLNGKATYYANSLAGRKTASGEPYQPSVFSAAHRTLPFGTVVRVVRTDTNRYVYVRITDRGPFAGGGRIIDLSYVAAERLGMIRAGVVPVRVEVLQ